MRDAFHLGGWGMYPTTVFGLVLLVAALQYARNPERGRIRVVRGLSGLVMLSSILGFVTGCINTFLHVGELDGGEVGKIALIGVGESLHNIGLGLVLLVLATIVTTIGAARSRAQDGAELTTPHAP